MTTVAPVVNRSEMSTARVFLNDSGVYGGSQSDSWTPYVDVYSRNVSEDWTDYADSFEGNRSVNWTDCGDDAKENSFSPSTLLQAVIYTFYSAVLVMAVVGNTVVCTVLMNSRRKWTVCNYFIVNMAASDILMTFFCIPFHFVPTLVLLYWPFGAVMCRLVSFSQAISVFVSAYSMMAISGDRYLAIIYPLKPRMTCKQAKFIILVVWLLSMLTSLPILLLSELTMPDAKWHRCNEYYFCGENWENTDYKALYTHVLFLLQYCFPLLVLLFTYGRIGIEIWGKTSPGEAHRNRDLNFARSRRKMIKMMIVVVVVFSLCWLPMNLYTIISEKYPEIGEVKHINIIHFACHWLAMSHSACNPVIYSCFNSKFRKGFATLAHRLGCKFCFRSWASVSGDTSVGLYRANTYTSYTCTGSCRYNNHLKNHPKQQQQFLLRNLQKQELEQENGGQYLESGSNSSPLQYRRSCHDSDRSQTHVFQSSLVRQHCPTSNCAESHM